MTPHLWRVKVLKQGHSGIAPGMEVEVIKTGTTAKPSMKEVVAALNAKYGLKAMSLNSFPDPKFFLIEKK